jgi:hypothetical protein
MWAVTVEGNNASLMAFREVPKHGSEAGSKTLTFLGNYAHLTARQLRQLVYVSVRAHDVNFNIAQ